MAGRGMGAASRGGGDVSTGPKNKMVSEPSMKTGKVLLMDDGGAVNQHKRMAMGMMDGGMPMRGYNKGGIAMGRGRPLQIAQTAPAKGRPLVRDPAFSNRPLVMNQAAPAQGNQMPVKRKKGGMAKKKKVKKMRYGGSCD